MHTKKKIIVGSIFLMLVITTFLVVSAKPEKKEYLELPPIKQPNAPEDGFIIYCDVADGNLKALDEFGETIILAIPQPPLPPYAPSNPNPADGAVNIQINPTLAWTGGDPNGDPVTYDVYFGTINPPPQVVSNQSATNYVPETLLYETQYFWKIISWDDNNANKEGFIWSFTTVPPFVYRFGIREWTSGTGTTGIAKSMYDDIVLYVKDYDETTLLLELPKHAYAWTEIHNYGVSIDYSYPSGIFFTGEGNCILMNFSTISEEDYTIYMKIGFTNRWHDIGCVFDYINETNYKVVHFGYDRDQYKVVCYDIIVNGEGTGIQTYYPFSGNTDYDMKVKVNHTEGFAYIYVNNLLEVTAEL